MSDLISREDVLGACIEEAQKARRYQFGQIWELNYYEIKEAINSIPTAEPKEGEWIDKTEEKGWPIAECSVCGSRQGMFWMNYCPDCGAKMERSE